MKKNNSQNSTLTPADVARHFIGGQDEDLVPDILKCLKFRNRLKWSLICLAFNTSLLIFGTWLMQNSDPFPDHLVREFPVLMLGLISCSVILVFLNLFRYLKVNPATILIEDELRKTQKRFVKLFGVDPLSDPGRAKEALIKDIFREATKANGLECLSLKPRDIWVRFEDMHNCGRRFFSIQPQEEFRLKRSY